MSETTSILNALERQLGPEVIQSLSTRLGADTAATTNAVSMAVPILLGALTKNVADADGAASLDNALTAHDGGIFDNIGALLGGNGAGAAILRHILGSRRTPVEDGL